MQPGNLQDEQRKLVDGVDELKRHEDPKRATAEDCEYYQEHEFVCSPPTPVWVPFDMRSPTMFRDDTPCPGLCKCFKPRSKGGRRG